MKRREQLTFWERIYVLEILRGLGVTSYHLIRNLTVNAAHLIGLAKSRAANATSQYPEQRKTYPEGYRGSHRLTLREDNSVRCTACFLCATACPAQCIYIEAGESPDPQIEKYPVRYEIDTLRCIYCGLCVEACPCDAIRMDTYVHPRIWGFDRKDFVETKEVLMHRSAVLAERGRDGNMDEMQEWYAEQDRNVYDATRPELRTYTERGLPQQWETEPGKPELRALDRRRLSGAAGSAAPTKNRIMVRVTVALVAIGLAAMFVAYAKGVGVIHGGDTLGHMYWATGAFFAVAAGDFIAIAHLIRAERLLRALRARCEQHGIAIDDLD